jgi:hypothetical protein
MKTSTLAVLLACGALVTAACAADATTPIDYRQRNEPYAPGESLDLQKKTPEKNSSVQDKRVDKTTVEKKVSPLGDRSAPIDLKETRPKQIREKDSHRPETVEQPKSRFDHRPAAISTAGDVTKPPTVAKYQDSLTAASATNMARFPAMDKATNAKINRFVFRKNPADAASTVSNAPITPAGGSPVISK